MLSQFIQDVSDNVVEIECGETLWTLEGFSGKKYKTIVCCLRMPIFQKYSAITNSDITKRLGSTIFQDVSVPKNASLKDIHESTALGKKDLLKTAVEVFLGTYTADYAIR